MNKQVVSLALLLYSFASFCATYYVSPGGSDSNSGLTPQNAFLTLQHASDVVAAGDSVIVASGTYAGFYHTTSGTSSERIVFSAQPGVLINAPNSTTNDGINLEGASYVTVEGFKVYGVPRAGLRSVLNEYVIFRNNIADSCGKWGILTGFSEHILIEGNECSRSVDEHGIYFSNSADNPVIQQNICRGNNANGIHMNGDVSLGGDGIISNALVSGNIILENGVAGGSGINCDGVQNSRIENNLIYNNHASGISLYQIDAGGGANNNIVVNNTILQPDDGRWALNIRDGSTGNIVFNNIFYSAHSFRGSITIDAASLAGFASDYNILSDRMTNDDGNNILTLAQWQQTTQQDAHSILATPAELFINPNGDDYHLSAASPAIDFGVSSFNSVATSASDIELNPRSQGISPDAGAYEFEIQTGIITPEKPVLTWAEIPFESELAVFDLSGKSVFHGMKKNITGQVCPGLYLFRTEKTKHLPAATGWLRISP